jgi:hypothetical protein
VLLGGSRFFLRIASSGSLTSFSILFSSVFQVQDSWPGYQFFGKPKFSWFSKVLVLTNLMTIASQRCFLQAWYQSSFLL